MFSSRGSQGTSDKGLVRPKTEISVSTFAYLFSELVQQTQARVSNVGELERRLEDVGAHVGRRLLETLVARERGYRRETRLLDALRFVHSTLWKYLFGHAALDLEQSNAAEDEYMISDADLFVTRFVSVPKELGHLNCDAFVAGIIRGALEGGGFTSRVTAHHVAVQGQAKPKTTFLIKVHPAVLAREKRLGS